MQCTWVEVVTQALAQKSGGKIPPPTSYVTGFNLSNNIVPFVKGMTGYLLICHQFQFPLVPDFQKFSSGGPDPLPSPACFAKMKYKRRLEDQVEVIFTPLQVYTPAQLQLFTPTHPGS